MSELASSWSWRALLGRHRRHHLLHGRHRAGHLLEQLVERLRVPREEVAVLLHEALEVGLLAGRPLLEHAVQLGHHVLHPLHLLGRDVLQGIGHLVELRLEQLLAQLVHQLLEALAGGVVHPVVLLELLDLAGQVGGQLVELLAVLLGQLVDDLLAPLVAEVADLLLTAVDPGALLVDDGVEVLGDLLVDAAEVVAVELLLAALLQPLHAARAGPGPAPCSGP